MIRTAHHCRLRLPLPTSTASAASSFSTASAASHTIVDVAIIGAGPAGLSAGAAARRLLPATATIAIIDQGGIRAPDELRPGSLICGVGGAGLWSDGKFSFFPSATALWALPDRSAPGPQQTRQRSGANSDNGGDPVTLRDAYNDSVQRIVDVATGGCVPPSFPEGGHTHPPPEAAAVATSAGVAAPEEWSFKGYESLYLSLAERQQLIENASADCGGESSFRLNTSVEAWRWSPEEQLYTLDLHATPCEGEGAAGAVGVMGALATSTLRARTLVVAGGRFWPLFNSPWSDVIGGGTYSTVHKGNDTGSSGTAGKESNADVSVRNTAAAMPSAVGSASFSPDSVSTRFSDLAVDSNSSRTSRVDSRDDSRGDSHLHPDHRHNDPSSPRRYEDRDDAWTFRRFEFGARIEVASDHPFFVDSTAGVVDPKLTHKYEVDGVTYECRTFCCCRSGMVCETEMGGLRTYSGRADITPTERSNIGFNIRCVDPTVARRIAQDMLGGVRRGDGNGDSGSGGSNSDAPRLEGARFDDDAAGEAVYGTHGWRVLKQGIASLMGAYPSLVRSVEEGELGLWGPTIEGVGLYPSTSAWLQKAAAGTAAVQVVEGVGSSVCKDSEPLWYAGDAGGKFRGIVAAMVSGSYCGQQAAAVVDGQLQSND